MSTLLSLDQHDRTLVEAFGDAVYAIGGRVRDAAIGRHRAAPTSKDRDYVLVGVDLPTAVARLARIGRLDPVGKSFSVIKLSLADGQTLDIALARRERAGDHHDLEHGFGPEVSISEDAARRDFTMNALSVRLSDGRLDAPAGALDDIRDGVIRMLAPTTFSDDPLRILRGVQFAARFEFQIEPATARAMRSDAFRLASVDLERIADELTKLLEKSRAPGVGFQLLADLELLPYTVPELAAGIGMVQNRFHNADVFTHNVAALNIATSLGGDLTDRWAALMHDVGKPATAAPREDGTGNTFIGHESVSAAIVRERLGALRYPHALVDDVAALAEQHMYVVGSAETPLNDATVRRFIRRVGRGADDLDLVRDRLRRQFQLRHADRHAARPTALNSEENARFEQRVLDELNRAPVMSPNHLAIRGTDVVAGLIDAGIRPRTYRGDRLVGTILRGLLEDVTDDPSRNNAPTLRARMLHHLPAGAHHTPTQA